MASRQLEFSVASGAAAAELEMVVEQQGAGSFAGLDG
jgi:hypothetical protein